MLEIAYLAGLIDGEGCIGFRLEKRKDRTNSYLRIILTITMTNFEVLSEVHKQCGGYLGKYIDKRPQNRQQWRWAVGDKTAIAVLKQISPYLIVKKNQAKLAIAFDLLGISYDAELNLTFKNKMHELNKRGVDLQSIEELEE